MLTALLRESEVVLRETRATRDTADFVCTRARELTADAAVLIVHSLALRGLGSAGGSDGRHTTDATNICPVCNKRVEPGESAGMVDENWPT